MKPGNGIRFVDFHTHKSRGSTDTVAIVNLMAGEDVPADFTVNTLFSAGIHPWQLTEENLEFLKNELLLTAAHPHVVLLGEAGFDRLKGAQGEVQERAFMFQASIAEEMGKPMVIHCVKGWEELVRAYRIVKPARPWVIHGFRGNGRLAASLAEEGFWFSLGTKGITADVLGAVSHERLLLETDDSGESVSAVYSSFAATAGYDEASAEQLIRNNFNSLLKFNL